MWQPLNGPEATELMSSKYFRNKNLKLHLLKSFFGGFVFKVVDRNPITPVTKNN